MGTDLPFLPLAHEKEFKKFAQYAQNNLPINDEAAAIAWCEFVDGVEILPKLPVHIRTHMKKWDRNQRIK